MGIPQDVGSNSMSDDWSDDPDGRLIRLCVEFIHHAEERTVEGDRLDGLPWSSELNAGYLALNQDALGHDAMLATILAITPRTLQGLAAKARVISRHQQNPDAEPIPAGILAKDVLQFCRGAGRAAMSEADNDAGSGMSFLAASR